jgi:TetR/AcrR family acrAB operon transcriptional repressor
VAIPTPSTAIPTKRAQQATETRQRLVDAAARLFADRGYTATSVAAIGESVGMSRGLVNFHFTTKEKLLHAVIEDLVAELESHMFPADAAIETPMGALAVLVQAHHKFVTEQPDRARLLFRLQAEELNPALGLDAFATLHQRWLDRTRPWWDAALASGELDPTLDHNAVATVVIGALRGIALEWLLAPEAVDAERTYAHLSAILERSLTV